jgi:hypothetical protein
MQSAPSLSSQSTPDSFAAFQAPLNYLAAPEGPVQVRIYPPTSGIATSRPAAVQQMVNMRDLRPNADEYRLDECGFALHTSPSAIKGFYDVPEVRSRYYAEVEAAVRKFTGALAVIMFDHNVRSAARAARGEIDVRLPAEQVHNDYTERSGPKRKRELLQTAGRTDLVDRHFAFVNLWRPIVGPVRDNPLGVCDARSVQMEDLVETEIQHYGEDNLATPRHIGEIYSVRYSPAHRWFYVSEMQPDEVLLLKCYDSRTDGRARFMPHTGFRNPTCPKDFVPRESIEARTLVVFDAYL